MQVSFLVKSDVSRGWERSIVRSPVIISLSGRSQVQILNHIVLAIDLESQAKQEQNN
ncbi:MULTISPECIES: hypothetical protein [unclassified Microcoleus]|uniref:hypothetical protein n=1 Tax=unclassified Microcoleus TaxID=2642155 RepID=UPI002FD078A3